ncbi:MAG TPA: hypothetical protein VGZ26_01780 [Pirellulales bacterium]|jgi:hypothetical protein|nr:hypothetical protein [Pirellulales bacterium]
MSSSEFEKLVVQVRSLSAEERQQLREILAQPTNGGQLTEDEFEQAMVKAGVLAPITEATVSLEWTPLVIEGEPLSETILKERR